MRDHCAPSFASRCSFKIQKICEKKGKIAVPLHKLLLFKITITCTASLFTLLCLLLTFHIRFLRNNFSFSKLIFYLCLILAVSITICFISYFSVITKFKVYRGQITKVLMGSVKHMINADSKLQHRRYMLYHSLSFKKIQKHFLKMWLGKQKFRKV